MASSSRRVLWKGAISFGLVHIPIALHTATQDQSIDFDWLDKRSMEPVGYKRVNKKTGKDIDAADVVKGIEYGDGQYVILSAEEIAAAYPKTTQTIEIESFVPAASIPFVYFERPYYIAPIGKADKVYALLREVLHQSSKVGIAKVVIQTKQHLAILVPSGPALILNLLRWGDEIRSYADLNLPAAGASGVGLSAKELQMGAQLVEDMSATWKPDDFTNVFKEQILKLVDAKVKAGETESVAALEDSEGDDAGATVYDLTELLKRSLDKGGSKQEKAVKTVKAGSPANNSARSAAKPGVSAAKSAPAKKAAPKRKAA